ncbi:nucleoside hydrolase-like domain-containing protein [Paradesertivirga mongoliensis]|uniref:Nucleoside hydrolase-like domain-containing protein n=1 Tax=Paradesertivirga mongoliensis TaxID=2100740 RepID=A0ABW4ZPZ8_9SPHI|nr:nucleoside hydrolase-like domain-containing protein [Pedobacter mongoliensis]
MSSFASVGQNPVPVKPRIIVSTDIGGTDPDDNQSMIHLLMYSDKFDIEGLVSSPSYGDGKKEEILRTIDLYEKDLPKMKTHIKGMATPDYLRSVTKQGRKGGAPYLGYTTATEGSNWIIKKANEKSNRPLWVLVWGGLDDLAQALHDAPEIQNKIKVYWIGGPNKKWSTNSYAYIAQNFSALWFIESNAAYRGFFSANSTPEKLSGKNYYANYIRGAGYLGKDFKNNRYEGNVKMGDTPTLLYLMDGDPDNPMRENWGGSYEKLSRSPRIVYNRNTTLADTVPVYSIVEFSFKGPEVNIPVDSACFTMAVSNQKWDGFYLGSGNYAVRYAPKQKETLTYKVTSTIPGFQEHSGALVVSNSWPGEQYPTDYYLGASWFTDKPDPELFDGLWQGAKTVLKWRNDVLLDWAKRWKWLAEK